MVIVEPDTLPAQVQDSSAVLPPARPEKAQTPPADFKQKDLKKELSIVAEDTTAVGPDPANLVEVSEQLLINKEWITLHEYYAVWDSRNINPYNIDVKSFSDTVSLLLYEKPHELWSPPLDHMHVTSDFGFRTPRWHYGTDVRLNIGDSVRTVFDGIIRIRKYDPSGYGNYIVVRHKNGLETLYGHLSKQLVEVGDEVKAGNVIGLGGNTGRSSGPHLHFETRYLGSALNPAEIYDFSANNLRAESIVVSSASFSYLKEAKKIVYHRVRSGDTLSGISRRYGVPVNTLMRLNGLRKNSVLKVGQRLRVH
ncbi:Glycyl-glycine endopeptidase ALE-1 precursor [Cesiribacter andamanensis AMV16]|uniref:Glycyl-glycine endopeptidase ALE-1 n=2 Tax=Cesiribacter TaxID=1133570 RepID=M7NBA2_9BACT|nr:Glycyl-glycine endopeptidase ALE-1 precursor [Cesiribacter andamanensis AMV16]